MTTSTDPGIQNVAAGVSYTINGVALVGILPVDLASLSQNLSARIAPQGSNNLSGKICEQFTGRKLVARICLSNSLSARLTPVGGSISQMPAPPDEIFGGYPDSVYTSVIFGGTPGSL